MMLWYWNCYYIAIISISTRCQRDLTKSLNYSSGNFFNFLVPKYEDLLEMYASVSTYSFLREENLSVSEEFTEAINQRSQYSHRDTL